MPKDRRKVMVICCFVAAWNAPPCSAATPDLNPVVVINVENPHALAVPELARAQELVTGIYERAGVTLRWTPDETVTPDRTLTLILTTAVASPSGLGADAMGHAPSPGDGTRGTTAYAFLDKVISFASAHRLRFADLIACAVAHEIGHLLLPVNAHRPDGIMRGEWYAELFPPATAGLPGFPPDQAKLLRLRARRQ